MILGSEKGNFRIGEGDGPHILYVAVSVDYQFDLFKVLHLAGNEQV